MLAGLGGEVALVPYINVPEAVLVDRLSGRWTCRAGAHVFHERFNPPQKPGVCDFDGSELYQRDDDKSETVAQRIRVYLKQTLPLIEYYRAQGKLSEVDGTLPSDRVSSTLLEELSRIVRV
jgi:adenylate kinase